MSFEEKNWEAEDAQVELALRNYRDSVRAWSEQEFRNVRTVRRSRWDGFWRVLANPVLGWSLACALVVASVGIPANVHHQRQLVAERNAEVLRQQQLQREAAQQEAVAMSDDELLAHVDSDIAQAAPDAMEPLASLMSDSSAK
jgi:cell division protein FtsL